MAYTFLNAVNIVLKRVSAIKGDAGELTSFVDTARQIDIDQARLAWNDLIQSFYSQGLFSPSFFPKFLQEVSFAFFFK